MTTAAADHDTSLHIDLDRQTVQARGRLRKLGRIGIGLTTIVAGISFTGQYVGSRLYDASQQVLAKHHVLMDQVLVNDHLVDRTPDPIRHTQHGGYTSTDGPVTVTLTEKDLRRLEAQQRWERKLKGVDLFRRGGPFKSERVGGSIRPDNGIEHNPWVKDARTNRTRGS